jgi:hypothetical protein
MSDPAGASGPAHRDDDTAPEWLAIMRLKARSARSLLSYPMNAPQNSGNCSTEQSLLHLFVRSEQIRKKTGASVSRPT